MQIDALDGLLRPYGIRRLYPDGPDTRSSAAEKTVRSEK